MTRVIFAAFGGNESYEALQRFGVQLERLAGSHYVTVTLPEGWRLEPDHSGCVNIVDERGRQRAVMGNTGDAKYYIEVRPWFRFSDKGDYTFREECSLTVQVADANGTIIYSVQSPPRYIEGATDAYFAFSDGCRLIEQWLDQNYPGWKSLSAYWD